MQVFIVVFLVVYAKGYFPVEESPIQDTKYEAESKSRASKDYERQYVLFDVMMPYSYRRAREVDESSLGDTEKEEEMMEGAETLIFRPLFSYRRDSTSRRRY